jgi:hypothetical protein
MEIIRIAHWYAGSAILEVSGLAQLKFMAPLVCEMGTGQRAQRAVLS